MSSEDLRKLQRDPLAAIQQQAKLQSSSNTSSAAAMAAALRLAQAGYAHTNESSAAAPQPVVGEQYLVFALGDREFIVKAEYVQGVERFIDITPVPNIVPWVRGVINLRGSIVSVVDFRMFLDMELLPYSPRTRLLSLQCNEMVICFVVDGVSEMLPIPPAAMNSQARQAAIPYWAAPYAAGCAILANRVLVVLDIARLLFSEKMQRYEALG